MCPPRPIDPRFELSLKSTWTCANLNRNPIIPADMVLVSRGLVITSGNPRKYEGTFQCNLETANVTFGTSTDHFWHVDGPLLTSQRAITILLFTSTYYLPARSPGSSATAFFSSNTFQYSFEQDVSQFSPSHTNFKMKLKFSLHQLHQRERKPSLQNNFLFCCLMSGLVGIGPDSHNIYERIFGASLFI